LLANWATRAEVAPDFEDHDIAIYGSASLTAIPEALKGQYIAIMAYLNRSSDGEIEQIRSLIAAKKGVPTTFGWGPRFLHSTGQFHKGGQPNGAFLQITSESDTDIAIPGKDFTFHTLVMAQALGDAEALTSRSYPLVRVHLKNKHAGIARMIETLS
jgi:glucose-6-phosphate isomerase